MTVDDLPGVLGSTEVGVVHVDAGGTIGRQPSHHRQMLAVLDGTARVQADDGPAVEVGPGTLVLWESGETYQVLAVTALLAVASRASACSTSRAGSREPRRHGRRPPGPRPAGPGQPAGASGVSSSSIRVLPRVFGFTCARSRNSATPSSCERSSSA